MPEHEPRQYAELFSFGEELRREREIRGISLKEIAERPRSASVFSKPSSATIIARTSDEDVDDVVQSVLAVAE